MRKGTGDPQYSNYGGTKIQDLSNPYRDTLNFYSKDIKSGTTDYNNTTDAAQPNKFTTEILNTAPGDALATHYTKLSEQAPLPGIVAPIIGDIYFDFKALIYFLAKNSGEVQDTTFKAANDTNRVWGITQGPSILTKDYSDRDARARPAAWSKDFNICNEELSTSAFAAEMNTRAVLTDVAVDGVHPDFKTTNDKQMLNENHEPLKNLQIMTGKYPARVAAWGGVGIDGIIDVAGETNPVARKPTYGRAEGTVVSIIASKFTSAQDSAQIKNKTGGVTLNVGREEGGVYTTEGLKTALNVGDNVTQIVGGTITARGTISAAVAAQSGEYDAKILTIGGKSGVGNINGTTLADTTTMKTYVYQLEAGSGTSRNIVAKGQLTKIASATGDSVLEVKVSFGSFSAVAGSSVMPDLRITTENIATVTYTDGGQYPNEIKKNAFPDAPQLSVEENNSIQELKLLSVANSATGGSSTMTVTLTSGTFVKESRLVITPAASVAPASVPSPLAGVGVKTYTDKDLYVVDIGTTMGGTLSEAVNLYVTEF